MFLTYRTKTIEMRVGYRESLGRFELTFDFAESFLGRVSRGAARYPAKLWVKAVFMTLVNISLSYQKIINMSQTSCTPS